MLDNSTEVCFEPMKSLNAADIFAALEKGDGAVLNTLPDIPHESTDDFLSEFTDLTQYLLDVSLHSLLYGSKGNDHLIIY